MNVTQKTFFFPVCHPTHSSPVHGVERAIGARCGLWRFVNSSPYRDVEVMAGFNVRCFNQKAIQDAGLKRVGNRVFDLRRHSLKRFAVSEAGSEHGIGRRNQMPQRVSILVGGNLGRNNDLHFFEFIMLVETEDNRGGSVMRFAQPRADAMGNLNTLWCKPVSIQAKAQSTQTEE
jgi:hypothetical protein